MDIKHREPPLPKPKGPASHVLKKICYYYASYAHHAYYCAPKEVVKLYYINNVLYYIKTVLYFTKNVFYYTQAVY